MIELRLITAKLAQTYDISLATGYKARPMFQATLKPEGKLPMIFNRRSDL